MRLVSVLLLTAILGAQAEKPLEIRFIGVEGGPATSIVSTSGESLPVDTGYPYAVGAGASHAVAEQFIADTDETTAHGIRLSAQRDASFTVTNDRNGHTKTYK